MIPIICLVALLLISVLYNLCLWMEMRYLKTTHTIPEQRGLAYRGVPTTELEILQEIYPDHEPDEMRARIAGMVTTDYT